MGVDVATFGRLLEQGFAQHWYKDPVTRPDINALGRNPQPGRRSLDAEGGLGLVLHYLNSTVREKTLCQVFAIITATATQCIYFGIQLDKSQS